MRYIHAERPGGPEVLVVKEGPRPVPGSGEVLIRVSAAGINRPDIMQREGKYPPPAGASPLLGLEVAGEVSAVGAGMTASLATSVKRAILSRISWLTGWSERRTITSGWMPMPRSSLTECWVGFVLSSPVALSAGNSVTCT